MKDCWLTCSRCSRKQPIDSLQGQCECGGALLVEYDLEQAGRTLTKESLATRSSSMWRYHEVLPVRNLQSIVSLGEGCTPLVRLNRLEQQLSIADLRVKREEQNPTGSFKSRGFSAAVSLLQERGICKAAVPSNGNAAAALAAYAARAGIEAYVLIPQDCPGMIVEECIHYGAHTCLVEGLIHDAAQIIAEGKAEQGWFNVGTLKEPGRVEGKKTMGWEIAEQLDWRLPDVIVYPTGGGSGIIGLWKAFQEMRQMGFVQGDLPRLVSVQEAGCQPIVEAIGLHRAFVQPPTGPITSNPTGMRVSHPPDGNLIVSILRETNGTALAVTAEEIASAQKTLGAHGISSSPEGAATLAGLLRLRETGFLSPSDRVVLFNTSHALKYIPFTPSRSVPLIRSYKDFLDLQNRTAPSQSQGGGKN
ncbi:threonine synthase [Effusibacillus pohliae]|uniref:threonine synthase n=1 Tax=Effusibacillus pohliae TaxID=232270 RepID=UPI00035F9949|nr:threonine synthase [Effusibacillus pohliae]